MKKISVVIACCNEEDNIGPLVHRVTEIMKTQLVKYDYEIICIDNDSSDSTQEKIRVLCAENKKIKAIFNTHNFGSVRSSIFGLLQATGDMVVKMCADFQDPPELLVDFVREYESGHRIVLAIKSDAEENKLMYNLRELYYKMIAKITDIHHIENFEGYGLYDSGFIEILRSLNDPTPYFRGIVAELGFKYQPVYYHKPARKSGRSKYNLYRLYDYAMNGITSYSKVPLRIAAFGGAFVAFVSFVIGLFYLVMKLMYWNKFSLGVAPVMVGLFFVGAVQLVFLGLIGEYISAINIRVMKRPLVTVQEAINMGNDEE